MLHDLSVFSKVPNGANSVTEGKIEYGLVSPPNYSKIVTPRCTKHGACLNVAITENGSKIWRCPACNEGAYETL